MITKWFRDLFIAFLKLWVIPPSPIRQIDPNEVCPGCGHCDGTIVCVAVAHNAPATIMHTCKVCAARWFTDPVHPDKRVIMATHILNPTMEAKPAPVAAKKPAEKPANAA